MATGRILIIDGEISISSKRCFSCDHFSSEKKIGNLEKYCSGYVIRVKTPGKGFCNLKEKYVESGNRCSHWKLDKKLRAYVR